MSATIDDLLDRMDGLIDRLDVVVAIMRSREERETGKPMAPIPTLDKYGSGKLPEDWKPYP
jgi:hypothetical protein